MNSTQESRKTVGVFMPFLSGIRGGPDVTAMWLIQALCAHYNVTLITTSQFDLDFFNRFAGTRLERDQFKIRRLPLLPTPPALPMSAIQGPLFQRSARACAAEFDLCLNAMNLIDLGVPAVHFLADLDWLKSTDLASDSKSAPAKHRKVSALRRIYHGLSARIQAQSGRDLLREDFVVSNSEWVASSLRAMGVESSVIYPPVPWLSREIDWDKRRTDFVWIGRIAPQKKVDNAIKIVAGLRNAGFDCAIQIAGTGSDKEYLTFIQDLAKRMGDWVVLKGPLFGEEKAAFLTQFRYALHTRADEPFGITLVELMKAGCIPFAPNSCGSAEILAHPALLFSNEQQAVAKIGELLSNPVLTQSVRDFLVQRAELFSTDSFCESAVTLISSILEHASSRPDVRHSQTQINSRHIGNHGN
jgi:glycosyltransferase involved in cell wall biosynthesis